MYNTSFRLPIDHRVKRRKITEGTKFVIWRRKEKLKYKVKGRLNAEEERMKIRIVAMGIGKMFRLPWTAVGNLQVAWAWYLFLKLIPGNFYDILWRCGGGDCGMHGRANSNSRRHVISEPRKITMLETKLANPKLVTSASAAYVAQLALPWNPPKWPKKPKKQKIVGRCDCGKERKSGGGPFKLSGTMKLLKKKTTPASVGTGASHKMLILLVRNLQTFSNM